MGELLAGNWKKLKSFLAITSSAFAVYSGISLYQGNEEFYNRVAMPLVRLIEPELAHRLAVTSAKLGLVPVQKTPDSPILCTHLWGMEFKNPVGMAAGFDKHAEAIEGLYKIGFGFIEVGSVTPEPQEGNPRPRVFRLLEDRAIINRYGFNSDGHKVVHSRLTKLKRSGGFHGIVGVNLGKNKHARDPVQDYVEGIRKFSNVADYFVVNVSSPNTPGLRDLQSKRELEDLLIQVNDARSTTSRRPPLLLKIAPDLSEQQQADIAEVVLKGKSRVDGIIVSNTTLSRQNLVNPHKNEDGGLSGAPVSALSTRMIAKMYLLTGGNLPIIGVGGIFDGADAYTKIKAGASLVQIYTSFAYHGPPVVSRIKSELAELMEKDGYQFLADAVGKEAKNLSIA